jgi:hypothetical protein
MITDYARCKCEITSRIATAKLTFDTKQILPTSQLDLNLRKEQVPVKCYIWSMVLCGAETWTLQKVEQKYLESFEMK